MPNKRKWLGIFWEMNEAISRDMDNIILHRLQNPIDPEVKAAIDIYNDSPVKDRETESKRYEKA